MKSFLASLVFISIVVAGAPALQARDKHVRFESRWREAEVKVDGLNADWPGPLEPFNDEPVSMGGQRRRVPVRRADRERPGDADADPPPGPDRPGSTRAARTRSGSGWSFRSASA